MYYMEPGHDTQETRCDQCVHFSGGSCLRGYRTEPLFFSVCYAKDGYIALDRCGGPYRADSCRGDSYHGGSLFGGPDAEATKNPPGKPGGSK